MPSRPRVLPLIPTKGLYTLSIGLGLLLGIVSTWTSYWIGSALSGGMRSWSDLWIGVIILALFLLPAWLFGRLIARVHPSFLPNLLAAVCYAVLSVPAIFCVIVHLNPETLVSPLVQMPSIGIAFVVLISVGVYAAIVVGILVCAVLSGFLAERFLGRRVIIQPGLICWTCGYNLGSTTIPTCPECGTPFHPELAPRSTSVDFLSFLKRHRRWPLALGLTLALAPLAYTITTHTIPSVRFLSACPRSAELRRIMNVNYIWLNQTTGTRVNFARPLGQGWWLPDSSNPNEGISVIFYPDSPSSQPAMFISRGCLHDASAAAGFPQPRESWWVYPGTENVIARIDAAQARQIIAARSVPSPLLDAIRAKSVDLNWAPQSSTSKWPSGEHKVDATPFFQPPSNPSESPPP